MLPNQIKQKMIKPAATAMFFLLTLFFSATPLFAITITGPSACSYFTVTPGENVPLAVDSTNRLHMVVSEDDQLKHKILVSGEWEAETIRAIEGTYTYHSIKIDASDTIHVCAYDKSGDTLIYARKTGTQWITKEILNGQNAGRFAILAVDPDGNAYICYADKTAGTLNLITNKNGSWQNQALELLSNIGMGFDFALDASGNIHLVYDNYNSTHSQGIYYGTYSNGSWTTQEIASGDLRSPSLAIDRTGSLYIAYQKVSTYCTSYDCTTSYSLIYATNNTGEWIYETVNPYDTDGATPAIRIDSDHNAHILSRDNGGIFYSTNSSGQWYTGVADEDGLSCSGMVIEPAIDLNGAIHFSYMDYSDVEPFSVYPDDNQPVVKYVNLTTEVTILHHPFYSKPSKPEFACYEYFQVTGANIVAYRYSIDNGPFSQETSLNEIKIDSLKKGVHSLRVIVKNAAGCWQSVDECTTYTWTTDNSFFQFETLSETNLWDGKSVITSDASGHVHVAYFNADNTLRYQTNHSGQWVEEIINPAVDPSDYLAIAATSAGKAYIAYIDGESLALASNISGDWSTEVLAECEACISIDTDDAGAAHIAYAVDEALYYLTNGSGEWVRQTLRTTGYEILYNCIVADPSGNAHICSGNTSVLVYSSNISGTWVHDEGILGYLEEVQGEVGLDIDTSGKAHIIYYDANGYYRNLKYTNNTSGTWATESINTVYSRSYDPKIKIDANQNCHIVITNYKQVKYITKLDSAWRIEAIDYDNNLKSTHSFCVDDLGQIHLLYRIAPYYALKYVKGFHPTADTDGDGIANYVDDDPYLRLKGDLDGNWKIDRYDLAIALKLLAGGTYTGIYSDNAIIKIDINGDGQIGLEDLIYIRKKAGEL